MDEYSIHGRLQVENCKNHQDMIIKLFRILKENGFKFIGETKEVKQK